MAHDFPFRLEFRTKHEMALDPDSVLHPLKEPLAKSVYYVDTYKLRNARK